MSKTPWKFGKGRARLTGRDIASMSKKVWVCDKCGLWHSAKPNGGCLTCGILATFTFFHSEGEAKTWAKLLLRQRAGDISELDRQIPLQLTTAHIVTGEPVPWAKAIIDFGYKQNGEQIYADHKPDAGMSYDAELKMRCLIAAGYQIRFFNSKGEIS